MVAGVVLLAGRTPARAAEAAGGAILDEGHLLADGQRASLERRLRAQSKESGTLLSVQLVPHLTGHQSVEELARATFADQGLDEAGPPHVLLVVALREHVAAIETGQGAAGIVPEIDARRIVRRLQPGLDRGHLPVALTEAIGALAASARATADRRRPLPPESPEPVEALPSPAPAPPVGVKEAAPGAEGAPATKDTGPAPASPPAGGRSLVPTAALVSAIVVLGLALRRRRRFAEERATRDVASPPERKGAPRVKSVGDRPMS